MPMDIRVTSLHDHDASHRRCPIYGFVHDILDKDRSSTPVVPVARDDASRTSVVDPGHERVDSVAREKRQRDSTQLGDGEQRYGRFRQHRHDDRHDISGSNSQFPQSIGGPGDIDSQPLVTQLAGRTVFTLPFDGNAGIVSALVDAVVHDVQAPVHTPSGPLNARGLVENLAVRLIKLDVEVGNHGVPKRRRVIGGYSLKLGEILNAIAPHETREIALGNDVVRWSPNHVVVAGFCGHRDGGYHARLSGPRTLWGNGRYPYD